MHMIQNCIRSKFDLQIIELGFLHATNGRAIGQIELCSPCAPKNVLQLPLCMEAEKFHTCAQLHSRWDPVQCWLGNVKQTTVYFINKLDHGAKVYTPARRKHCTLRSA